MPDLNAKVRDCVERELRKDPTQRSVVLQEKCARLDESLRGLSGRQFHARYALPVRRRLSGSAESAGQPRTGQRSQQVDTTIDIRRLLSVTYGEKQARLTAAIAKAFERAIETDSLAKINKLFAALDRHTREFDKP